MRSNAPSAFDRIRAECVCVKWVCTRMYRVRLNTDMQECVCEIGRCGQTNAGEFERKPVSTFECTGCAFKRRVQSKFFFFFLQKLFTTNTHIYIMRIFTNTNTHLFHPQT
jgi:late competence protein required for DNA uptake (superfamily II DNA/RNA helicase)